MTVLYTDNVSLWKMAVKFSVLLYSSEDRIKNSRFHYDFTSYSVTTARDKCSVVKIKCVCPMGELRSFWLRVSVNCHYWEVAIKLHPFHSQCCCCRFCLLLFCAEKPGQCAVLRRSGRFVYHLVRWHAVFSSL